MCKKVRYFGYSILQAIFIFLEFKSLLGGLGAFCENGEKKQFVHFHCTAREEDIKVKGGF